MKNNINAYCWGKSMSFEIKQLVESTLVTTYDYRFTVRNEEVLCFRLEIYHSNSSKLNQFWGRVFKLELYRLNPTFPFDVSDVDDVLCFVVDHNFKEDDLIASSVEEIKGLFMKKIEYMGIYSSDKSMLLSPPKL